MAFPNPDASWAGLGRKNFYASFCALVQAKAVGVDGYPTDKHRPHLKQIRLCKGGV